MPCEVIFQRRGRQKELERGKGGQTHGDGKRLDFG